MTDQPEEPTEELYLIEDRCDFCGERLLFDPNSGMLMVADTGASDVGSIVRCTCGASLWIERTATYQILQLPAAEDEPSEDGET